MKKLMVVLLAVSCYAGAKAQVQFGVKAGANLSTVTGSDVSGVKTLVGFQGGVLASIPLLKSCSLQPEIIYSGQGAKSSESGSDLTLRTNYLNVPVLFKYAHSSGLFVATGPQIGFLLSANMKSGGNSEDVKSSYKSTDFSWAFGLGYLIPSVHAGIDLRYNLGLTNIANDQGSGGTLKNSVFQAGVFYLFGGKK